MLVLSRERDESIILTVPPSTKPQVIEVFVTEFRGNAVRLGFHAADEVEINRREVQEAIDAERGAADLPRFYHSELDGLWFVFDRTDPDYKAGPHYTERQADHFIIAMTQAVRPKQ